VKLSMLRRDPPGIHVVTLQAWSLQCEIVHVAPLAWLKHFAEDMGMPEAFAVPSERARPAAEPVQEPLVR